MENSVSIPSINNSSLNPFSLFHEFVKYTVPEIIEVRFKNGVNFFGFILEISSSLDGLNVKA